jgi:DNA-binding MarR family transcriptional regulator
MIKMSKKLSIRKRLLGLGWDHETIGYFLANGDTPKDIARMMGCTEAYVKKIIKEWEKSGYLKDED